MSGGLPRDVPAATSASAWPTVPACHGWLALDARGVWRLRGETVSHPGLIAFLNAHYTRDGHGRWFVSNGPQQVFVDLEAAPLILRLHPDGSLRSHTGRTVAPLAPVLLDADGNAFMATGDGPAALDDRDLAGFAAALATAAGEPAGDADLLAMLAGGPVPRLYWRGLEVAFCARADIPQRLGYQPHPAAAA